jgi:glycosyltransferase involved in cell wall biosynthesis
MTNCSLPVLCVVQPFDPRGEKIGGIESHMRELIRSCPPDMKILLIGIDEVGDLNLGEVQIAEFAGRQFEFMPLLARTGKDHLVAAKSLRSSLTAQFFFHFFANFFAIRRLLRGRQCSIELQRFEYSTFGLFLGRPTLQMIHGEGSPDQPMDSILRKYWWLNRLNERITINVATRLVGVNPAIVESIRRRFPFAATKAEFMTVSVNTDLFAEAPVFPPVDRFKICFAGRLDAFKRPDLMFLIFDDLRRRHRVPVEFHYIGNSDPARYAEYERIRDIAVMHGVQNSENVARLLGDMHAGILVSEFEGMPVYALEMLSVGRPLVVLDLPQMAPLVEDEVSGAFLTREGGRDPVQIVSDALKRVYDGICAGRYRSSVIRGKVAPFSHRTQLGRLFDRHRELQAKIRPG